MPYLNQFIQPIPFVPKVRKQADDFKRFLAKPNFIVVMSWQTINRQILNLTIQQTE
jgi:hypothetical protein